ncbi:MAG: hypothetical protein ACP5NE_02015 [Candidatus Micrarchaeia archaeon]
MKKKVVYSGIIIIIVGIAVLLLSGSMARSILPITQSNFTVAKSSYVAMPTNITNSSRFFMIFESKSYTNLYLLNTSAYAEWHSYINGNKNASGLSKALTLKGKGAEAIFANVIIATFPILANKTSEALYYSNISKVPPGNYYIVIDNTNGSKSSAESFNATVLLPEISFLSGKTNGNSSLTELAVLGLVMITLFILGLVLVVYGLISKPKTTPGILNVEPGDRVSNEYIDELYNGIGGNKKGKKRKKQ